MTASGTNNNISLPLTSLTHQMFILASSEAWGGNDDCQTLNIYLHGRGGLADINRGPKTSTEYATERSHDIIYHLLVGIHIAIAFEVLEFGRKLGINTQVFRTVVKDAAGSSVIFDKVCAEASMEGFKSSTMMKSFEKDGENLVSIP